MRSWCWFGFRARNCLTARLLIVAAPAPNIFHCWSDFFSAAALAELSIQLVGVERERASGGFHSTYEWVSSAPPTRLVCSLSIRRRYQYVSLSLWHTLLKSCKLLKGGEGYCRKRWVVAAATVAVRRNSSAGAAAAVGATGAWHNVTSAPLRDITLLLSRCAPCYSPSSHFVSFHLHGLPGGTVPVLYDSTRWPQRDITQCVFIGFHHILCLSYLFILCFPTTPAGWVTKVQGARQGTFI